jgi:hypothetical protein
MIFIVAITVISLSGCILLLPFQLVGDAIGDIL